MRPIAIKNFVSYSMQRLGTDYINLYQPGRLDPHVPIEDTIDAIADLIKEGKVHYLGLSEATADQIRRALKYIQYQLFKSNIRLQVE
jgi:pyridoxine 4-dehydrogenase